MSNTRNRPPRLPPRWFVRSFWLAHRGLYRISGGRLGLWRPRPNRWGTLTLTTLGRRTGKPRAVIVAYFEDGENLVALAMNGWAEGEPAWWLNLQEHPEATVNLSKGQRMVTAGAAQGDERVRLWRRWQEINANIDAYAALRPSQTAVVVFQPRQVPEAAPTFS